MSINDTPEVRDIFGEFNMQAVGVKYSASASGNRNTERGELLIGAVADMTGRAMT